MATRKRDNIVKAEIVDTRPLSRDHIQKDSAQRLLGQPPATTGRYMNPPYETESLADLFAFNGYHTRCVLVKAILTAGLGLNLVPTDDKAGGDDTEKATIQDFLDRHEQLTGQPMIETLINWQTDFEIFGNGYLEAVRDTEGTLSELYHMPAYEMRIAYSPIDKASKGPSITRAIQIVGLDTTTFWRFGSPEAKTQEGSEYLHLRNYSPKSRWYGFPDYIGSLATLILDRYANEFNIRRFNNNAVPDWILTLTGGKLGPASSSKIKEFMQRNFKGQDNAGKTLIIETEDPEAKMAIERMNADIKEASYRYLRQDNREEIVAAHGVPPRIIGIAGPNTLGQGAEAREQMRIFRDVVLRPRQSRMLAILNGLVLKQGLGIRTWKWTLNEIEVRDAVDDADFYTKMIASRILSADESRHELGYEGKAPEDPKPATPPAPQDGGAPPPVPTNGNGNGTVRVQKLVRDLIELRKSLERVQDEEDQDEALEALGEEANG